MQVVAKKNLLENKLKNTLWESKEVVDSFAINPSLREDQRLMQVWVNK